MLSTQALRKNLRHWPHCNADKSTNAIDWGAFGGPQARNRQNSFLERVLRQDTRPAKVYHFNTHVSKRYSKKQQGRVSFRDTRPCAFAELLFNSVSAPHSRSAVEEVGRPRYLRKFPGFQRFLPACSVASSEHRPQTKCLFSIPAPQEKSLSPRSLFLEREA